MSKNKVKNIYVQKYKKQWEKEPLFKGWLSEVPGAGNELKAHCKYCKCVLKAHRKDLLAHKETKKHKDSIRNNLITETFQPITNFTSQTISNNRKIIELKLAAFAAEHCSMYAIDHLGELITKLDENSQTLAELRLHRTKCTALIKNVLSPCFLKELAADVGDTLYSVIIDESTSIDTKKVLCFIIRYFSAGKSKSITSFYRLIEIEQGDAATIATALKNQLANDGLNYEKLIGIGIDGANVMIGRHNSVAAILKNDLPELVIVRCVCHSFHLAAENATKVLPRHLEFIVRDTHNWFSNSTKRQVEFSKIYNLISNKSPLKIDKLSGTRWLARSNAIGKILEQWDSLQLHFQMAATKERCYTAELLCQMFRSVENKIYLIFLKNILTHINKVNILFQGENVDPLKLFEDLHNLLYSILQMIVRPDCLERCTKTQTQSFNFENYLMPTNCVNFGYSFNELSSELTKEGLADVKERCRSFLIQLCKELQKRLPDNMHLLEKIVRFSPGNATSQIKPDISQLISRFRSVCKDPDATLQEWNLLHTTNWKNLNSSEDFWAEVFTKIDAGGNKKYHHISTLATTLLSLPFSNACVERAFSIFNIVKDKLRNRLSVETVDSILRVRYSLNSGCTKFNATKEMIKMFNSENMYHLSVNDNEDNLLEALCEISSF